MAKFRLLIILLLPLNIAFGQSPADSIHTLPEATVTANKVKLVFKSARYSVIDYAFFDSGLLIAASKGNFNPKPVLLLINTDGDTLAKGRLNVYPQRIISNCAGVPFIITEDSLYRIDRFGESLVCGQTYPIWMADLIASCQLMKNGVFYYRTGNPVDCSVSFTRRSLTDSVLQPFAKLDDLVAASAVKYDATRIRHWFITHPEEDIDVNLDLNDWNMLTDASYQAAANLGFNRHNFRDLFVATTLYKLDDSSLLITDYLHKRLCYFSDTGTIISTSPMESKWSDFHKNALLRDDVTGRFYIHFSSNAASQQIRELKLRDGIAEGPTFNFERPFAEHVSVHDGKVYFLQHDPSGGAVRQLFVQRW